MDKQQFLEKIQAFGRIEYLKGEGHDRSNNATRGVCVKELTPKSETCSDCGLSVKNRRIQWVKSTQPEVYWREHCTGCGRSRDPITGQFDVLPCRFPSVMKKVLKERQGDK